MAEPVRGHLMDVRRGRSTIGDVIAECTEIELRLSDLLESSLAATRANVALVESFVIDTYEAAWAAHPA